MSETKFTPGPWLLRGLSDHVRVEHVTRELKRINVARCGSSKPGPREPAIEEVCANAHLIAAAPAMYEALALYEKVDEHFANCEDCFESGFPELCAVGFPIADEARLAMRAALASAREETTQQKESK